MELDNNRSQIASWTLVLTGQETKIWVLYFANTRKQQKISKFTLPTAGSLFT